MTVRLASIDVEKVRIPPDMLRELDEDWAATLGAMMDEGGQAQPIRVAVEGDGFVLDFGLHRLWGRKLREQPKIDALVDDAPGDRTGRRKLAIFENIGRSLTKLDRAVHIGELYQLLQAESPQRKRGGDRRSSDAQTELQKLQFGLSAEIAERVGLSERTVAADVAIARGIGRTLRQRITTKPALRPIADKHADLVALAAQPDQRQSRILDIIAAGEASTVAEAVDALDGTPPESETERHWKLANNAFARLRGANRNRFFAEHEKEFLAWRKRKGNG